MPSGISWLAEAIYPICCLINKPMYLYTPVVPVYPQLPYFSTRFPVFFDLPPVKFTCVLP